MPKPATSASYGTVAKILHWLIALAIIAMLIIGWTMTNIAKDNPYRFPLFQWHKSIGITILLLSVVRLVWRLIHSAPSLPSSMPRWEKVAAQSTHWMFYIFMIGMPLTGWVLVSTSPLNLPTMLYGLVQWPNLPVLPTLENKREIGHMFGGVHYYGAFILAALLVLHVGAALKHHWLDKDDVLMRMLPSVFRPLANWLRGMK